MSSSPFIASGQICEHFWKYIEPSVIDRRLGTVPLPVAKSPPFAEPKSVALQRVSRVGRRGLEPRTYGLKAFEPSQWASVKYSVTKHFNATETHAGPHGHPPGVAQVRNADASTGACSMA